MSRLVLCPHFPQPGSPGSPGESLIGQSQKARQDERCRCPLPSARVTQDWGVWETVVQTGGASEAGESESENVWGSRRDLSRL